MAHLLKSVALSCIVAILLLFASTAQAHEVETSYIFLKIHETSIEGRLEIAPKDFNHDLGIHLNLNVDDKQIAANAARLEAHLAKHMAFSSGGQTIPLNFTKTIARPLDDEADQIAVYFTLGVTDIPDNIDIRYTPFFNRNPHHEGVLIIEHNWKAGIIDNHLGIAEVFNPKATEKTLDLTDSSLWNGFWAMVRLGMHHIWIGLDHILFLVALILPSVVRRRRKSQLEPEAATWRPVDAFKPAFLYLLGIITSFTVAHSITLGVAAFGLIDLPSRYVESLIAFSIAVAAFHNIRPIFKSREWMVTFAFGLFHGLGFASVLGEKGLGGEYMALSLLGFNVGVEVGQIVIVAAIFPFLYLLRKTKLYPHIIKWGSVLLILIAMQWVIERLFEIDIRIGRLLDSIL